MDFENSRQFSYLLLVQVCKLFVFQQINIGWHCPQRYAIGTNVAQTPNLCFVSCGLFSGDGTLGRLGKSGVGKLSLEEVQDLYPAPFGLCSHPWREIFHGIIPGGTPVVATRIIPPISADPKRVSRDFDSECKKLRLGQLSNVFFFS